MSELIPFRVPSSDDSATSVAEESSPVMLTASRGGSSRPARRAALRARRARRWDPAFHVDLLSF